MEAVRDQEARRFEALVRTDRCCRLIVKQLRESYPSILEAPEFEKLMKQTRRQFRENRELLGTGPPAEGGDPGRGRPAG